MSWIFWYRLNHKLGMIRFSMSIPFNKIVISCRDGSVPVLKTDRRLSEDHVDHSGTAGTLITIM